MAEQYSLKRKRQEETPELKLPGKLHHALREVKKSAKKAKTFETQKLVKKLKGPDTSAELETQLDTLKHINLDDFAGACLRNKLKKDRVLSPHPSVEKFIENELASFTASFDAVSIEGKIRNKLLSSKSFSSEMGAMIEGLRAVLQPRELTDAPNEEEEAETEPVVKPKKSKKAESKAKAMSGYVDEHIEDTQIDDQNAGWESGSVDAVDTGFESDFVEVEGSDNGWESGSIDGGENPEISSEDDLSDSEDSDVAVPILSALKSKIQTASSSTFLPSLSVGFIPGGDGSDSDDFSDADSVAPARKNRRGQRARQAIWEKKFGKGAKHVTKQREMETEKLKKKVERAATRATVGTRRERRAGIPNKFQPPTGRDAGYASRSSASAVRPPAAKRAKIDENALHPSWEAKKKLKEKAAILPSRGNRIVF